MRFEGLTHVGPRNDILDVGKDRTNPFAAAKSDKSAMRPFVKLLWTLVDIRIAVGYACNRSARIGRVVSDAAVEI